MNTLNFIFTILGSVISTLCAVAVGTMMKQNEAQVRMGSDIQAIRQSLETIVRDWERRFSELVKDVEYLKSLIEQQRKWKWDEMAHDAEGKEK